MSAKYTFWAWKQKTGSHTAKIVLLKLADAANDEGESWYSIPKMLVACEMSDRAFRNQLRKLEELGLLTTHQRDNRSSVYALQADWEGVELKQVEDRELFGAASGAVPPAPSAGTPAPSADDPNKYPINESNTSFKHGSSQSASELNGKNALAITGSWTGNNGRVDLHGHLHDEGDNSLAARVAWEIGDKLGMGTCWEGIEPGIRRWMKESIAAGHKGTTVEQLGNMAASLAVGIAKRAGEPF